MPKGIPLTEEEMDRRRHEIIEAAMQLFFEKGFNETSMREIAAHAGSGKSTLYDYFSSKDEVLIAFVIDEVRHLTIQAEQIIAQDLSVAEKCRRIIRKHLEYMTANKRFFLKLSFEVQRMKMESQQKIQEHRHVYQDMLGSLILEGIQTGEFREVNPLLVVRGIFAWLSAEVFTSRPTGTPEEMMSEMVDILFKGLEA